MFGSTVPAGQSTSGIGSSVSSNWKSPFDHEKHYGYWTGITNFNGENPFTSSMAASVSSSACPSPCFGGSGQSTGSVFGKASTFVNASPLGNASPVGFPTATPNSGGTSSWAFVKTSSPLSSTTTFGGPLSDATTVLGSSVPAPWCSSSPSGGHSTGRMCGTAGLPFQLYASDNWRCPFGREKTFGDEIPFASSVGNSNSVGEATRSLTSETVFDAPLTPAFLRPMTTSGCQATETLFGFKQSDLGGQEQGSRLAFYRTTIEVDDKTCGRLESISAMPVYKDKSHEELKWEDYQFNGKGYQATTPIAEFSFEQFDFGGQKGGSILAFDRKTIEVDDFHAAPAREEVIISISAMPVYSDRSHEELRWEDYQFNGKGFEGTRPVSKYSFEQSDMGGQKGGSRLEIYRETIEDPFVYSGSDIRSATPNVAGFLLSISAMSVYNNKSHEELRWEDYQDFAGFEGTRPVSKYSFEQSDMGGQKGGSRLEIYRETIEDPFVKAGPDIRNATPTVAGFLLSISAMSVYNNKSHEELRWEDYQLNGKGGFGLHEAAIQSTSSIPSWNFFDHRPTFTPHSSTAPSTTLSTPIFGPYTISDPGSSCSRPTFTSHSWTSPIAPSRTVTLSNPVFGPNTVSDPGSSCSTSTLTSRSWTTPIAPSTKPTLSTPISAPCTNSDPGSLCSSAIASYPSISSLTIAPVSSSPVSCGLSLSFSQPTIQPASQTTATEQSSPAANPFGTLSPKLQITFGGSQHTGSIQYEMSSIPVHDKPAAVRGRSLLTIRHLSEGSQLPVQKYDPKLSGPKVTFSRDRKEIPVDVFLPRENPRAFLVTTEKCAPEANTENLNVQKYSYTTCEKASEVFKMLRKLQLSDYYTEPPISELEAKEREEPGFCSHVKDFVIGRHGYGSIRFMGETDVRKLDTEAHVQFNNREVIVYLDESKKPPVGQGLNKPAEITLLNVKCIDRNSGKQYTDGLKVDNYRKMLMKKAAEQGVEFVSYDPVKGEWKFRVQHF